MSNIEEIKAQLAAEPNPSIKKIYLNHLKVLQGEIADCASCVIEEVKELVTTIEKKVKDVFEPIKEMEQVTPTPSPEADKE